MDDIWSTLSSVPAKAEMNTKASEELQTQANKDPFALSRDPIKMMKQDLQLEDIVLSQAPRIAQVRVWSDNLCEAAWELSNYVPPNLESNLEKENLWKGTIIPKLVQALQDDIVARNTIEQALGSITSLAITIAESAALIKESRGSPSPFGDIANEQSVVTY